MQKTTILGILTITATVINAALQLLKGGALETNAIIVGMSSGMGLIKAQDANH